MGRLLYSYSSTTPAVRIEPEQPRSIEKWSYWNPFDPDSDEFFHDAVHECEVPQGSLMQAGAEGVGSTPLFLPAEDEDSSEASSSGRGSPVDEVANVFDDASVAQPVRSTTSERMRRQIRERESRRAERAESRSRDVSNSTADATRADSYLSLPPSPVRSNREYTPLLSRASNNIAPDSPRPQHTEVIPVSRDLVTPTTSSAYLPAGARGLATAELATPLRPVTPPNQNQSSYASPSPPPTVTPRLYSWSHNPMPSHPPSLMPTGPLTNRSARLSVTHISRSPALIPVPRVVV